MDAWGLTHVFDQLVVLTPESRQYLSSLLQNAVQLQPRRKLLDEHKPVDGLFVGVAGWLVDYRQLKNGCRQILNFRLPGEVIGIESLLYGRNLYSCAALTRCTVLPISQLVFEEIQQRFPRLFCAILLSAVKDRAIAREWEVNLGRRHAVQRIAHLFLELERRLRASPSHIPPGIHFPLKQQDIADCTGLTVPYVNQVLKQMRNMGLINLASDCLEIQDLARLARIAGFSPDYLETTPVCLMPARATSPPA
jgi:CRP-like cAMP-binding protein